MMFVKQRFCVKIDRTMILFVFYSSSYIFKEDLEELYKEKL
ncbi:hypothetical protein LEP1GSC018_0686 [Leptospira kirschneri str. 2008720114]|nr:hypothetical protein LEP1GSC018_0686 [Leptospira kirschneri str. 2008720114]